MKREKFLWPLTQSHHRALAAAKRVREGLAQEGPSVLERAREEVLALFEAELNDHFSDEERMMELVEAKAGPGLPEAARFHEDHKALRALGLSRTREELLLFAQTLTAHVRFEEETLFPLVERVLDAAQKEATGKGLLRQAPSCGKEGL